MKDNHNKILIDNDDDGDDGDDDDPHRKCGNFVHALIQWKIWFHYREILELLVKLVAMM